jgi:hypothetical protein
MDMTHRAFFSKPSLSILSTSPIGTKRRPPTLMVRKMPAFASRFAVSRLTPNIAANSPKPKARRISLLAVIIWISPFLLAFAVAA